MRYLWLLVGAVTVTAVLAGCTSKSTNGSTAAPASPASVQARPTAANTRSVTIADGSSTATVTVELAVTEAERERGLMARDALADDAGMLFLFPAPSRVGFWMKGTLIPLDIAYLDADGRVLDIKHGKPLDETRARPGPALPLHAGSCGRLVRPPRDGRWRDGRAAERLTGGRVTPDARLRPG